MLTTADINRVNQLLESGQPFALFALPNDSRLQWSNAAGCSCVEIVPWLQRYANRITPADVEWRCSMPVASQSTSYGDYIAQASRVIESCRMRRGKTVLSRVVCHSVAEDEAVDWGAVAAELFAVHPSTFRFLYYTPATGAWLGASPELLLDFNRATGEFKTISLAGTRAVGTVGEWDDKNIRENRFVENFILEQLHGLGIEASAQSLATLTYGNIEHLCACITGRADEDAYMSILDAISPTPALCGFPKEDAVKDIADNELHQRYCYGGYVGVKTDARYLAFVNLRCAHFSMSQYCIYTGGGITAMSDPEAEHRETSMKMQILHSAILRATRRR
jgi:isochorismate synthase